MLLTALILSGQHAPNSAGPTFYGAHRHFFVNNPAHTKVNQEKPGTIQSIYVEVLLK